MTQLQWQAVLHSIQFCISYTNALLKETFPTVLIVRILINFISGGETRGKSGKYSTEEEL